MNEIEKEITFLVNILKSLDSENESIYQEKLIKAINNLYDIKNKIK